MNTIADAFLNDFDEEEEQTIQPDPTDLDVNVETINMDDDSDEIEADIITDLLENPELKSLIKHTEKLIFENPENAFKVPAEQSSEYQTIIKSNQMIRQIEDEIIGVHKHACNIYASRFPELEQTVLHPVQYAKVVRILKNDIDSVSEALEGVVSEHQKLSTSISASATTGRPLPESELTKMIEACDIVVELDSARGILIEYVKSRMLYIAPNLSALVGPDTAAQLMSLAGGLQALSKIPSCNVQTLGSTKKGSKNEHRIFSKSPHVGLIGNSPIILDCPEGFVKKAMRLLASKISLAVRLDCHQTEPNSLLGEKYFQEIQDKIEKWQEPPDAKTVKPLPLPEEKRLSKRAGKRYRKMREKFKVTELQRMKNRVGFNVNEARNDEGEGFGMIGKSGTGGVLKITSTNTTRVRKLDKLNKLMIDRERKRRMRRLTKGESSGLATSVVMTDVQGMSLVNPEAAGNIPKADENGVSTYFGAKSFSKIQI